MKVTVINSAVPFVRGGAEILADDLVAKLKEYGHDAQLLRLPDSVKSVNQICLNMLANGYTKIPCTHKVIALKYPCYYVEHENKSIWLLHQFRQAYDLLNTKYTCFGDNEDSKTIINAIYKRDNECFKECEGRIFTISDVVSKRIKKYNNVESTVCYPPLFDESGFYNGDCGDYLYYPSRVNSIKRQRLAVEAMRYVKSGVKLIITGRGDIPENEAEIFSAIKKYNLGHKVKYINSFISRQAMLDYYANCLGVLFIPYNEDYGYITLEGLYSKKPVITCEDSGGACIFVKNGYSGYVSAPKAKELAEVMDKLFEDKQKATAMGQSAYTLIRKKNISWDNVIRSLLV